MEETPRAESAQRITIINTYRENVAWSGLPHRRPRAHTRVRISTSTRPIMCARSRVFICAAWTAELLCRRRYPSRRARLCGVGMMRGVEETYSRKAGSAP
eukprot:scaffold1632_cov63-Phaeocystis_antarctica.AAC.2